MILAGVIFVPTKYLTDGGVMRVAGQYRAAAKDGRLSHSSMPSADADDDAWQEWV